MSTFNSLQTHKLEKPYDYWVTWKTGFIKKPLISVKYDLGNGGFGLTTDTNSQRSDSPKCEAHLDIKLHFERDLEYCCEGSSKSDGACRRVNSNICSVGLDSLCFIS